MDGAHRCGRATRLCFQVFLQGRMFQVFHHPSNIANVSFEYFKSELDVAHIAMLSVACHHLPFVCELPDQRHGPIAGHQQLWRPAS
jgi:hypothetical protein